MSCPNCGSTYCISHTKQSLYCAWCTPFSPKPGGCAVDAKVKWLLEEHFTVSNVIGSVKEYSKANLLLTLISELDQFSNQFFRKNGIPEREFNSLPYIIKGVYKESGWGDEKTEDPFEETEVIETLKDGYGFVIPKLENVQDGLSILLSTGRENTRAQDLFKEYELRDSEYGLCYSRCVQSILVGNKDLV